MKYRIKNIIQNIEDNINTTSLSSNVQMETSKNDQAKKIINSNINEYSSAFILENIKNNELLTNSGKIYCMKDNKENPNNDDLLLYSSDFSSLKFLTSEYNTVVNEVNNILEKNATNYKNYNKINLSADTNEVK